MAAPTLPFAGRRLHFVGVGGCGMSGLALISRELGAEVTGSDMKQTIYLQSLRNRRRAAGAASVSVDRLGPVVDRPSPYWPHTTQ